MQGKKENEFVAFISRNKENKKYYCYLFAAKNSKMVYIIFTLQNAKMSVVTTSPHDIFRCQPVKKGGFVQE